jgi:hypothetical protein
MVPQIDAQNSSLKEGVQVFPIGTWVPLNCCGAGIRFCTNSCQVSKGYMYVFQFGGQNFQRPTLASYPPNIALNLTRLSEMGPNPWLLFEWVFA